MRKTLMALGLCSILFTSCYTMNHTVGTGASGTDKVVKKQWYALWGLVPINTVDSKVMASGASNYTITTRHSFVDLVIGFFTSIVTIQPTTVEVTK